MAWHRDSITDGELDALKEAANLAWSDDTRLERYASVSDPSFGQCYVTARWLVDRLGGKIGNAQGHFAWLSSDGRWAIDLTAGHNGTHLYGENNGYYTEYPLIDNERTKRFARRANLNFENLDVLLKVSLDYMGDAYPAEEPQATEDRGYWHDEPAVDPAQGEYKFVYGNGGLEVSPAHDHHELADHAGVSGDHRGPVAVGWIVVADNRATWEVQTNISLKALERVFKDYCKNVGWQWGGMTNIEGEPISDEFAPSKTSLLRFAYANDHLYLGKVSHSEIVIQSKLEDPDVGWIKIQDGCARVWPVYARAIESLYEWATDNDLILYSANDNVYRTIPDLESDNTGTNLGDEPKDDIRTPGNDRETSGLYRCPDCERLFPNWHEYSRHRKETENSLPEEHGGFPELNQDAPHPFQPHFTPQQPEIMPMASLSEAERAPGFEGGRPTDDYFVAYHSGSPVGYAKLRNGKLADLSAVQGSYERAIFSKVVKYTAKEPKDLLASPVPFIYDVFDDTITVGKPGQRTSEIPGKFTPGGIVEGTYHPGGKVAIRSMTNVPYTVRHMIQLWYYQHPELAVKSVSLQDDAGRETKLAAEGVGGTVKALALADPAASQAITALQAVGGKVYVVGGAVRDAVAGRTPKDIDLMVTGLEPGRVEAALKHPRGARVDLTGKDFGVFRFRYMGNEVEVALPRRDRNTGDGHKDFEVQADHTMTPEEDLWRRDFTVNAMAVDLQNGKLIDPYGGQEDIQNNVLRSVRPESLSEDPLRIVRALVARGRHGFNPDDTTRYQMGQFAHSLDHLPAERIKEELDKLFKSDDPAAAIRLAHETGALKHILPEVDTCMGYDQNNPHHELELGNHLLSVLERTAQKSDDPDLRLAALLHDIGKPASAWVDPETGKNHYYLKKYEDGRTVGAMHEEVGADMAEKLMDRLRYPKDRTKRVSELVKHHMWKAFTTEKGARKFLNRVGDHADDLMTLRWADQGGKSEYPTDPTLNLDAQRSLLDRVHNEQQPTQQSQLAINGKDILGLGVPPGPQVGQILRQLTDAVIDDPRANQRDTLLNLAQGYATLSQQ